MKVIGLLGVALLVASGCGDDDGASDAGARRDAEAPSRDATASLDAAAPGEDAAVAPSDGGTGVDAPPTPDSGPPPEDCTPRPAPALRAEDAVADTRFDSPVFLASPPGEPDTLFIVEKPGRVRVVVGGALRPEPFLDMAGDIVSNGEQGLLGMAFHPEYEANGRVFFFFTPRGRNVVAEFARSDDDPYRARGEVARLVDVQDRESNHNGGMIAFGPDGSLYVAMGDEGGGGDDHGPIGNALNRENLFGSILRLDVDAPERDYAVLDPAFEDGLPQIWHYGLRNPWRFSFDRRTGDLYIADVGQNRFEEINFLPAGAPGGANFGWRAYEGTSVFREVDTDEVPVHTEPIVEYRHDTLDAPLRFGCSITGGYVYRGDALPALDGFYLYGDVCSQDVVAFRYCEGEVQDHARIDGLRGLGNGLASFAEDGRGEMYILYVQSGHVLRIVE